MEIKSNSSLEPRFRKNNMQNSGVPQNQAVAAAPQDQNQNQQGSVQLTDEGNVFMIRIEGTPEAKKRIKDKLKSLKIGSETVAVHNSHSRAYRVHKRNYGIVAAALTELGITGLDRPLDGKGGVGGNTVTVTFTQTFQWPGSMEEIEAAFAKCGLKKVRGAWTGDLSKAPSFMSMFGITGNV